MKKKLTIEDLNIKSFVTSAKSNEVKGGATYPGCVTFTNCNTCQCSEAYTICCPETQQFTCTGGPGL